MFFSSSQVWMWELDHKEGWAPKNAFKLWCWKRLLRVPWTERSNQSVLKEINLEWRTDVESEAPILWPPDATSRLIGKDLDAEKDWEQEEKGVTEDEMVGWHHWLNGHKFEQTLGDSEGQGSLAYCSPWSCKELDQLNDWTTTKLCPHSVYLYFFPNP